jgi:hypothetical protein
MRVSAQELWFAYPLNCRPMFTQGLQHFGCPGLKRGRAGGNDEVNSAESDWVLAKRLPDGAFDPVSVHGPVRHTARDRHPQASVTYTIRSGMNDKKSVLTSFSATGEFPKLTAGAYAVGSGKTELGLVRIQALRRARPLARRALKTLRPPFVAMRARKPCTRLRFSSLGWKVLFIDQGLLGVSV